MRRSDYTAANRAAWNQAAPIHAGHRLEHWLARFSQPGYHDLDEVATAILEGIGLEGKTVAQLCCNNGRDLISILNLGARRGVGFDQSERFIDQARQIAAAAGVDCEFVVGDVYDIGPEYNATFDLIHISIGALGWLPDLPTFLGITWRLLRPGGWLFIYESHPLMDMLEFEPGDPTPLRHSYFRTEPYVDTDGLDYIGGTQYQSSPAYWFHHKLSDIIGGVLEAGYTLRSFREYPHDISKSMPHWEELTIRLPLSYSLTAQLP